jgi:hypothetical protein
VAGWWGRPATSSSRHQSGVVQRRNCGGGVSGERHTQRSGSGPGTSWSSPGRTGTRQHPNRDIGAKRCDRGALFDFLGFLTTNAYHYKLGASDFSLLRTRFILTGVLTLAPLALALKRVRLTMKASDQELPFQCDPGIRLRPERDRPEVRALPTCASGRGSPRPRRRRAPLPRRRSVILVHPRV